MIRVAHLDYRSIKEMDNSIATIAGRLVGYRTGFMLCLLRSIIGIEASILVPFPGFE